MKSLFWQTQPVLAAYSGASRKLRLGNDVCGVAEGLELLRRSV